MDDKSQLSTLWGKKTGPDYGLTSTIWGLQSDKLGLELWASTAQLGDVGQVPSIIQPQIHHCQVGIVIEHKAECAGELWKSSFCN